jgi:hypothetical protein
MTDDLLLRMRGALSAAPSAPATGLVRAITGLSIRAALPGARIGDLAIVERPASREPEDSTSSPRGAWVCLLCR